MICSTAKDDCRNKPRSLRYRPVMKKHHFA
jgi:hypothetical protein